ncbi:hypothetical protein ADIS_4666 [Lunatimonas lonarensis]|uniref:DUF4231 domain-containing protein n=1 Tax=Lunatimonas lonarensis TaxID=1232681 RepID=R7ZL95_9BACT|nr:DUF4231 domain-containing protein [Lunatimonas lonarensis]EON74871.1 hypothetical protein ADIS_4666 [Lunatimonas lonarensis]
MNEEEYLKKRLDDQIGWYGKKSKTNKTRFRFCQVTQLVLATIITLSGSFPIEVLSLGSYIIPLIGAAIAIISGLLGLYKYQEHWLEYRTVCESLKHEKYLYLTKSEPYDNANAFTNLVKNVESLISKENSNWSRYVKEKGEGKGNG